MLFSEIAGKYRKPPDTLIETKGKTYIKNAQKRYNSGAVPTQRQEVTVIERLRFLKQALNGAAPVDILRAVHV